MTKNDFLIFLQKDIDIRKEYHINTDNMIRDFETIICSQYVQNVDNINILGWKMNEHFIDSFYKQYLQILLNKIQSTKKDVNIVFKKYYNAMLIAYEKTLNIETNNSFTDILFECTKKAIKRFLNNYKNINISDDTNNINL